MENIFNNETLLNKEVYYEFYKFHYYSRIFNRFSFIFFAMMGIFFILSGAANYYLYGDMTNIWIGLGLIAYVMLLRLLFVLSFKRQLKSDKRIQTPMICEYEFDEDSFNILMCDGKGTVKYEDLYKVVETNTYFYLYLNASVAYLVLKEGFLVNDSEQFRTFIMGKKGKKFYNKTTKNHLSL